MRSSSPPPSSNRTGGFPASGLPESSRLGHAQGTAAGRSQQAKTEVLHQVGIERPVPGGPVPSLTATFQMVPQAFHDIAVELVEAGPGIAVAEVATPSFQIAIDLGDQLPDRHEVPLSGGQLP